MRPATTIVDATETEFRDPLLPSLISELEAQGFKVLGRVATNVPVSRNDYVYDQPERQRLAVWRARPASTVLAATDGTSFANVDTFGDAPLVRLRTELSDGLLIETVGVALAGVLRPRRGIDPLAGFTVGNAPGRSVRLNATADPQEVLASHALHLDEVVARRDASPIHHVDRAQAVRQSQLAAAHTEACSLWLDRKLRRRLTSLFIVGFVFAFSISTAFASLWRVQSPIIGAALAVSVVLALIPVMMSVVQAQRRRVLASTSGRPAFPRG
ncbi:hypothetical protein [Nocardioides sp.]|uniref:hypothetical protein n=1 Tax=Nocardioides sp. TaxID=35761 RepID=UPI002B564F8F|nr:hypothetical protein [Nocardioides sp.]HXH81059.1 hypothetical protein [Nocardioides sp.]